MVTVFDMKRSPLIFGLLFLGSAAAGWIAKPEPTPGKESADSTLSHASKSSSRPASSQSIPSDIARQIESVSFSKSLSEIAEEHHPGRLTELALWLADANSEEMTELWRALHQADKLDASSYDLFMKHWTKIDPRGALAVARETGHERVAWWAWGKHEPEKAFAACQTESPEFLSITLRGIGQDFPDLALRLLEENPNLADHVAVEGIAQGMDDEDPLTALEFAARHGKSFQDPLKNLVRADPAAALEWMNSHPGQSHKISEALAKLVAEHTEQVPELLAQLPTGQVRKNLVEEFIAQIGKDDLTQAIALIEEQPGSAIRSSLYAQLATQTNDPSKSLEFVNRTLEEVNQLPAEAQYIHHLDKALQKLLLSSPDETIALLQSYESFAPDRRAVANWTANDPIAAATWLGGQPPGDHRDQYAATLATSLLGQPDPFAHYGMASVNADFAGSLAWSEFIEQEELRSQTSQSVITNWLKHQPEEAAEYFSTESVDPISQQIFEALKESQAE